MSSLKKYENEGNDLKIENKNPDSNPLISFQNNKTNDQTNINDNSSKRNCNNYLLCLIHYF